MSCSKTAGPNLVLSIALFQCCFLTAGQEQSLNSAAMDINDNVGCFSMLFLAFLDHSPCHNQQLERELHKLNREVKLGANPGVYSGETEYADHSYSGIECDGELETDGHFSSNPRDFLQDVLPVVPQGLHVNAEDAQAVRVVAEELIRIADDLNHSIVSQAAESLAKKLTKSSPGGKSWHNLLAQSVDHLLREVPGVHTEHVVMALTFSLVKAVCEHAPPLLRGLYNVLMNYSSPTRPR